MPDEIDLGVDEDGNKVELSCHILARAVEAVFPDLRCVDGYFATPGYNHSWLVTQTGHIIDTYPIGILGGPQMIDNERPSPWFHLYHEMDAKEIHRRYGDRFKKAWFARAVGVVRKALRKAAKSHCCEDIEIAIIADTELMMTQMENSFTSLSS